jgi:hypothetical protein
MREVNDARGVRIDVEGLKRCFGVVVVVILFVCC